KQRRKNLQSRVVAPLKGYDKFHTPLPMAEAAQKAESCHQELIKRLDKSELRLVLRIIDAKDKIAEAQSLDSFLCGFHLAWRLSQELEHYMNDRPVPEVPSDPGDYA
ncbi:MAG: DUF6809 family protein, partial [Flavonifractor plautii]